MRWAVALVLSACSFPGGNSSVDPDAAVPADMLVVDTSPGLDAGSDGGVDGGADASLDAAVDAAIDAAPDAAIDADPPGPWRRPLVITTAQAGATNLTSFPVYIDLTDPAIAAAVGGDSTRIDFRTPIGDPLAYEIASWEPNTGRLRAWVQQTIGNTDRTIYLHYGSSALAPPSSAMTFSNSFVSVWHLDTSPAMLVPDARGTATGTPQGGMTDADRVDGKLGSAIDFDGTNDAIQFTNPLTGAGKSTISAWVRLAPTAIGGSYDTVFCIGESSPRNARWMQVDRPGIAVGFYVDDWDPVGKTLPPNEWHLLHWTYDDATTTSRFYFDGVEVTPPETHNAVNTTGAEGFIGLGVSGFSNGRSPFFGSLDEVRLSSNQRSQAWITAEWRNQSAPTTFVAPGTTEEL